jgi:hypothetical protein
VQQLPPGDGIQDHTGSNTLAYLKIAGFLSNVGFFSKLRKIS